MIRRATARERRVGSSLPNRRAFKALVLPSMTAGPLPVRARNTVVATASVLRVPRVFIGVFVGPGLTATTRTPVPWVSAHSAWVNETTYAFVAAYTAT